MAASSGLDISCPDSGTDDDNDHDIDHDEKKVQNAIIRIAKEQFVRANHVPVSCHWPICNAECKISCSVC